MSLPILLLRVVTEYTQTAKSACLFRYDYLLPGGGGTGQCVLKSNGQTASLSNFYGAIDLLTLLTFIAVAKSPIVRIYE